MVRAAAKNHQFVAVVVDPADYAAVLAELRADGAISAATKRRLARDAFARIAAYDAQIASWFDDDVLPDTMHLSLTQGADRCATARTRISRARDTSSKAGAVGGTTPCSSAARR